MSDAWEGEGFSGENDWGAESVEADLEEDSLFEPVEADEDDFDSEDEE
jgi:hypothetical protein